MRTGWHWLVLLAATSLAAPLWAAEEARTVTCKGKVLDEQGQPLAGAKVTFYEAGYGDEPTARFQVLRQEEKSTQCDGDFAFTATSRKADSDEPYRYGLAVAGKPGLGLGWLMWNLQSDLEADIVVGEGAVLAGRVVDAAGQGVAGAEVEVFLRGGVRPESGQPSDVRGARVFPPFMAQTDEAGRFRWENIPKGASADFVVRKAGRATVSTAQPDRGGQEPLTYLAGESDIEVVQPLEACVEGKAVEKASGKALAGLRVILEREADRARREPIVAQEDGSFRFVELGEGTYRIMLAPPRQGLSDWVAESVPVTVKAGQTAGGLELAAGKGGILEVIVQDASKKPVREAQVAVQRQGVPEWFSARSDQDGSARFRLLPGDYELLNVYHQANQWRGMRQRVAIEEGRTGRIETTLGPLPKVAGIVRDDKGQPLPGAAIAVWPMGDRGLVSSDAQGKFETSWNPRDWGSEEMTWYLVVRHQERNLAVAEEIGGGQETVDVKLEPAVAFVGRVVNDQDKPVPQAKVEVTLILQRYGNTLAKTTTDEEGRFEVKAIPPGQRYSVQSWAQSYGSSQVSVSAEEMENQRQELEPFVLSPANRSLAGVVVDEDDQPVAGAQVYAYGNNQPPDLQTTADKKGQFRFAQVCGGRIQVNAQAGTRQRVWGDAGAEGGDAEVKVVVHQERGASGIVRDEEKTPRSLVGKLLPEFKDIQLDEDPNQLAGKPLLVCFVDLNQRPSRHIPSELAKCAEALTQKNVTIISIRTALANEKVLTDWAGACPAGFRCGVISGREERTLFAWGVRGLPWLILADQQHRVKAEGFGGSELAEKLAALAN